MDTSAIKVRDTIERFVELLISLETPEIVISWLRQLAARLEMKYER
jgi:hypothetical protein